MRRKLITGIVMLSLATTAFAADYFYNVVSSTTMSKGGLGSVTITQPSPPVQFQTTGTGCKVFLNTTSAKVGWPVAQNTVQQFVPGGSVTSLKFTCYSSAIIYMVK